MRKVLMAAALVVVAVAWSAADGLGEPNFFYEPASIGLILPEDTEQSEDEDGAMNYVSEGKLYVKIAESEVAYKDADILNEKKFAAALKEIGAEDIKPYCSIPEGDIVYNSASISFTWDDGSVDVGYMLIVNSKAAKGKSFIVGIFGPSIDQDYDNPVFVACDSIGSAKSP